GLRYLQARKVERCHGEPKTQQRPPDTRRRKRPYYLVDAVEDPECGHGPNRPARAGAASANCEDAGHAAREKQKTNKGVDRKERPSYFGGKRVREPIPPKEVGQKKMKGAHAGGGDAGDHDWRSSRVKAHHITVSQRRTSVRWTVIRPRQVNICS